jgi:hypothetical protein
MYKATGVPVGVDQAPHIEITREIARRFNNYYGDVFPEPDTLLTEVAKVPGTDGRKMSKSYNNAVFLSDSPKEIEAKLSRMITDPRRQRRFARQRHREARFLGPAIAFCHRHVIDTQGGHSIVIGNRPSPLLGRESGAARHRSIERSRHAAASLVRSE